MYYVQTSKNEGKTFETVNKMRNRTQAFKKFVDVSETERALLFRDNVLILATNLEDAKKFAVAIAARDRAKA